MMKDGDVFTFKEGSWEPDVEMCDGALIYRVPVNSGFCDVQFNFQITHKEFEVLKSDEKRRYFLYAFLHNRYQLKPSSTELQPRDGFKLILFGRKKKVERFLTAVDVRSRGSISSLLTSYMKCDIEPMLAGKWFQIQGTE